MLQPREVVHDRIPVLRPREQVHAVELPAQLRLVAVHDAAHHDDPLQDPTLLEELQVQDRVDVLLYRILDEGAGVDDAHPGVLGILDNAMALERKASHQRLAVHTVLGTAHAHKKMFNSLRSPSRRRDPEKRQIRKQPCSPDPAQLAFLCFPSGE